MLVSYIIGSTELSDEQLVNADFNIDESIDILDAVLLVNVILGNV